MTNTTSWTNWFAMFISIGSHKCNLKIPSPNEARKCNILERGKTVGFEPLNMLHTPITMFLAFWFAL
jgi:hypothetical protein